MLRGMLQMAPQHLDGVIALKLAPERIAEEPPSKLVAENGNAVKVALDGIERQRLEGAFRPKHLRRPVRLRVEPAEKTEERPAHGPGHQSSHALFIGVPSVTAIPAEVLVAAVSRERDGDPPPRELRDAVGRHRGAVGERLVVERRQAVHEGEIGRIHGGGKVVGSIALRDFGRVAGLVEFALSEADGAGIDGVGRDLRHHRDDGARIDTAGKKRSERHLGHEMTRDRGSQTKNELIGELRLRGNVLRLENHVPVPPLLERAAGLDGEGVTGGELVHAMKNTARLRDVAVGEEFLDRLGIDAPPKPRMSEERLELGSEEDLAVLELRVVERFDPEPVPREKALAAVPVPERVGEHPIEALDRGLSPLLPGVDHHLGVAMGAKHVAPRAQLVDQAPIVVDFAVVDEGDGTVLVIERLASTGDVDDRQPPVCESDSRLDVKPLAVRSTVPDRVPHGDEKSLVDQDLAPAGRRCPLFRTSQLFPSQLRRPSREKAVVDLEIARHHSVEAELFFGALAARLALLPPELLVVHVARQDLGEPLRVPRGNERSGDSILDQLRVSADAGGNDGKPARHGFQDGVRDSFHPGREREQVQGVQNRRHVVSFAREPGVLQGIALIEDPAHLVEEQAVAYEDQAGLRAVSFLYQADERSRQREGVFHLLHPGD